MSDFDIFNLFDKLINEQNKTPVEKSNQDKIKRGIEEDPRKLSAPMSKKKSINQDIDKKTEDEDLSIDDEEKIKDDYEDEEDESPSTIHLEDAVKFKKLRSALNQFRASHSLSDPEIMEEMKDYFERLSTSEKKVLFIFVKGLTQVTLSDAKGKAANIPSDFGFSVEKKGASSSEKIKSKKRKIKAKKNAEDNMSPIPIVVGEGKKQSKEFIYKILQENR